MTYSYHWSAHFCHQNDDGVRSHLESHVDANGDDYLTEMTDENVFSRTNSHGYCGRENGGETLSSTVSGVVACHEKISLRTESDLYNADPHQYRSMLGNFPLIVVGAGSRLNRQMTTGLTQLRLTDEIAQLRLLKMAAQLRLTPEIALNFEIGRAHV